MQNVIQLHLRREEVRDESGERGVADKGGTNIGQVNKWCFQCASVSEAAWIYGLVTQEVVIGSVGVAVGRTGIVSMTTVPTVPPAAGGSVKVVKVNEPPGVRPGSAESNVV